MAVVATPEVAGAARVTADEGVTELYAATWSSFVRLGWLLVRDERVAEEIVQDAFVALHGKWDTIRDQACAEAYLRRSVVNRARSVLRHRQVEQVHAEHQPGRCLPEWGRSMASAEHLALERHEHRCMLEQLERLPRRQREVLILRYYLDLSEAQIAHALGIAAGSVKAHAHRGLAALREHLRDELSEDRQ